MKESILQSPTMQTLQTQLRKMENDINSIEKQIIAIDERNVQIDKEVADSRHTYAFESFRIEWEEKQWSRWMLMQEKDEKYKQVEDLMEAIENHQDYSE